MKSIEVILSRSSYQHQLDSEEWAAFAKRIKERHPFCRYCRRKDVLLNVHHIFYDWSRKLWEYNDSEVVVLCETCHNEMHEQLSNFRRCVFQKLDAKSFKILNAALAVALDTYEPLMFSHALCEFVSNGRLIENHAKSWKP